MKSNENTKEYAHEEYDLTNPAPIKKLNIQPPEALETDADYTRLFHYMVSYFHASINMYSKKYGYGDRQRLLVTMLNAIKELIPEKCPELIQDYPKSLPEIEAFIGQLILISQEYTGRFPEGE